MSVSLSVTMERLPFGTRPRFGDAHPLGLVLGHISFAGDGTGGTTTAVFNADSRFLYRLESFTMNRGDGVGGSGSVIVTHVFLEQSGNQGDAAFNLAYAMSRQDFSGFSSFALTPADSQSERRLPIGRFDQTGVAVVAQAQFSINSDTIIYQHNLVLSYWRREALYTPGFLQAFWEAPLLAPGLTGALRA